MCDRIKHYECDDNTFDFENDYIFVFAKEVNDEIASENDDVPEENDMTVHVKTINGKTISIKCDKEQKAAIVSDEVGRRSWHLVRQGKVMNEKKTMEENDI